MEYVTAVVLGIALGITEFLPISSLGHSLVLEAVFNFPFPRIVTVGTVTDARNGIALFIQGGAVLAVLVAYRADLLREARSLGSDPKARRLWLNVLIAFIPIGVLGLALNKPIMQYLFTPVVVALALIVGGMIFLIVEGMRRPDVTPTTTNLEDITVRQAVIVGVAQITALIPGISRSGATIIGGLLSGMSREVATRFTFYLFIPTLGSAALYALYKQLHDHVFDKSLLPLYIIATVVAFATSLLAIQILLRYISTHSFRAFGIYRIVIGVLVLVLIAANVIQSVS